MKEYTTFPQIRSRINTYLGSTKYGRPYKKRFPSDPQFLLEYLLKQLKLKYKFKDRLKRKDCYRILRNWIETDCDPEKLLDTIHQFEALRKFQQQEKYVAKGKVSKNLAFEENRLVIANTHPKVFYNSPEWKALRYEAFSKHGNKCQCCGASPSKGIVLHIDHIKPRSIFPELAFELDNLQVLCEFCNIGKSNKFEDDWREGQK